jgi:hypothetical protein
MSLLTSLLNLNVVEPYKRRDDRMQVKPGNYLDLLLLGFSCFTLIEDPSEGGKRCSGPGYIPSLAVFRRILSPFRVQHDELKVVFKMLDVSFALLSDGLLTALSFFCRHIMTPPCGKTTLLFVEIASSS